MTKHSKNATTILGDDFNTGDIDWDRGKSRHDTHQKAVDKNLLDTLMSTTTLRCRDNHLGKIGYLTFFAPTSQAK